MIDINFDELQKTTVEKFLAKNPHISEKETMSTLVDTMSKLMTTMLSEYHSQTKKPS